MLDKHPDNTEVQQANAKTHLVLFSFYGQLERNNVNFERMTYHGKLALKRMEELAKSNHLNDENAAWLTKLRSVFGSSADTKGEPAAK